MCHIKKLSSFLTMADERCVLSFPNPTLCLQVPFLTIAQFSIKYQYHVPTKRCCSSRHSNCDPRGDLSGPTNPKALKKCQSMQRCRVFCKGAPELIDRFRRCGCSYSRILRASFLPQPCRTLFTAGIAAVMSTCDSVKTVLSGAVFTLINASTGLRWMSILAGFFLDTLVGQWKVWKYNPRILEVDCVKEESIEPAMNI